MKFFVLSCLFFISFASDVIKLSSKNFQSTLSTKDHTLVEFYAPWCGHCQSLEPEYKSAAKALKSEVPSVALAKVDATQESDLAEKFGIQGYPTIKLFKNGEFVRDYNGPRSSSSIVNFMKKVSNGEEISEEEPSEDQEGEYPPDEEAPNEEGENAGPEVESKGVINLDSYTFDKIVGTNFFDVLVKFDVAYPYGEKEDEFIQFSHRVANISTTKSANFIVATVGVEDYGEKDNDDLRIRFNIKTEEFPVYRLFKRSDTSKLGIRYTGSVDVDSLSQWISQEIGLWIGRPGCLEAFDKLLIGLSGLDSSEKSNRLEKAIQEEKQAEPSDKKAASYYVRILKKIVEKGFDVQKEAERMERVMESKISDNKKEEMKVRLNILASFGAKITVKKSTPEQLPEEEGEDDEI